MISGQIPLYIYIAGSQWMILINGCRTVGEKLRIRLGMMGFPITPDVAGPIGQKLIVFPY